MYSTLAFTAVFASFASLVGTQSIDPDSVPLSTRDQWCLSQTSSCPLICLQLPGSSAATLANDCDPATLTFDCVCANGQSPNASEYSQTLPYFICTQNNNDCVTGCNGVSSCQSACRQNHPCGAQDPQLVNTSTITTMPATSTSGMAVSTASDGAVYTGFGGSAATTTAASGNGSAGKSGKNAATTLLNIGQVYGLGMVAAGIFTGFTLLI